MAGKSKIKSIRAKYIDTKNKYHYKKSTVGDVSNPIRRDFYRVPLISLDGGGDANADGSVNVLDIVTLVNAILNGLPVNPYVDMNGDNSMNILDVVSLAQCILNATCPATAGAVPGADGCFNEAALNYGSQFDCCYDCVDCDGGNYVEDCNGNCFDLDYWGDFIINNNICDDGINTPINVNCELSPDEGVVWDYDNGDCIDYCQSPGSFCNFNNAGAESGKCDCSNTCVSINEVNAYFGDGVCHDWLQCTEFLYDNGDCNCNVPNTVCNWANSGAGLCDCSGNCINPAYSTLIGNGSCNNDPACINFNCVEFEYDGGDCEAGILNVDHPGDSNMDGVINVQDLVGMVECIINGGDNCNSFMDVNFDGSVNIQDIISMISCILSNDPIGSGDCEFSSVDVTPCDQGDFNCDGQINIQDIIAIVSCILDSSMCNENMDPNEDFQINVQDIIHIVGIILGNRS